jgi:glutaredoxin
MTEDNFVVFSKDECDYCTLAKQLLLDKEIGFAEFVLPDCEEILAFMKYSGLKTVPQVFVNGMIIGGYSELEAYFAKH